MGKKAIVEILTNENCCLCDEAKGVLRGLQKIRAFDIREVDITSNSTLLERYREEIPVVFINGRKAFKYKIDPGTFLRKLDRISKG
jgi:glutaredoxin